MLIFRLATACSHLRLAAPCSMPLNLTPVSLSSPAGHVHTYYRTCSVRREQCVIDGSGISHFTIGSGGREMSDALEEQKWLAAGAEEHGFVRFDATSSKLHARFIRTADDTTGDEVTLFPQVSNEGCAARR